VGNAVRTVVATLKWAGERLVAPLRRGNGPNKFRLSSMETATTTYDGDHGWARRPPVTVACPRCDTEIPQYDSRDDIDCHRCVAEFPYDELPDIELLSMVCPVCENDMEYGQRHPEQFDFPEWATCHNCRYHWEFEHSYSAYPGGH